ncbi:MAG: hypothetical protein V2I48_00690 [Xanthomonadales bacterium]|jgi:hypothetical protein|nr:hypothetical protein [Xanthomonadales bacterium]
MRKIFCLRVTAWLLVPFFLAMPIASKADLQSEIVKVLTYSGELDRTCRGVGSVNDMILASLQTKEFGCELWHVAPDGNHALVADINAGETGSGISFFFGQDPPFKGWHYFGANDGIDNYRVWRTDGVNVEQVKEDDPVSGGFEPHWSPIQQVAFKGRNYFFNGIPGELNRQYYSSDGATMRTEPQDPSLNIPRVNNHFTLFDKLILTVEGGSYSGHWVFDGTDYQKFEELIPGAEGLEIWSNLWFYIDESWVFRAGFTNEEGRFEWGHFLTDGQSLKQIPHTGTAFLNTYNALGGSVKTREAQFAVGTPQPYEGQENISIFQVNEEGSSDYEILVEPGGKGAARAAILDNEALVLADNVLYRLGETEAQKLAFDLPTAWNDSEFKFIGSNAYYRHAFIKETHPQEGSRVWVWNHDESALLMAGDDGPVTDADFFRHIGNDIYFYGEDQANGWALRRIPNATVKRLPAMARVTGSWFDPTTSGQGFMLHPINDRRTVYSFYSYEDDGSLLWLTGTSEEPLEPGETVTIDMRITSGGNFGEFTPDHISNESWGTVSITFDTCSKGTALLNGLSGQQNMELQLLAGVDGIDCYYVDNPPAPETVGITGSWFDPATSGQGLFLHSISDDKAVFYFYGYKKNAERLWLSGVFAGQIGFGKVLSVDLIVTNGGKFGDFDPEDITRTHWGTLSINFADCENATATLDGLDGQQTMNMIKLTGLQGSELDCNK